MALPILLAESDKIMRQTLQSSLRAAGFHVIQASDGEATWDLLETHTPVLVLMEAVLPGLSTCEILARLQARGLAARPPVIVIGDEVATEELVQWFHRGADNYLSKPFSMAVLLAQVRSLLRRVQV